MPKRKRTYKKARRRTRRRTGRYTRVSRPAVKSMIKRALKPHTDVIRLSQDRMDVNLTQSVTYFNLSLISAASAIFNTLPTDVDPRRARHAKLNLDCVVSAATENDGVNITAYIVSVKNNTPDNFFDANSGALVLGPNGTAYAEKAGLAYVNPEYFNIHMRKRMYFPPRPQGADLSASANHRRFTWNISPGFIIRNNTGRFDALQCPQKPSQNYYLMMFNNNNPTDLEYPTCTYHVLNTYIT